MEKKNNMDTNKNQSQDAVATVVAAFAQRPDVSMDDIVLLAQRLQPVFAGEADLPAASTAIAEVTKPVTVMAPALPIEKAVTEDKVYCLCCGKGFTMLKRHLMAEHGLTEDEYRQMFALPDDMPLVAPKYSQRKAAYAKQVGLGKYSRDESMDEGARVS